MGVVHVKAHRRGKSLVKAYLKSAQKAMDATADWVKARRSIPTLPWELNRLNQKASKLHRVAYARRVKVLDKLHKRKYVKFPLQYTLNKHYF